MDVSDKRKRPPRCVFYSHDTMGFGHIRRNMLLSQTVLKACPDAEVLLISGVREAGSFALPAGADSLILPSYIKTSEGKYFPRSLGKDVKSLVRLRSQLIYAALNAFSPDIMVVDNVPRGAMRELDLSLPLLTKKKTHMVLGLRDIIDSPEAVKKQWSKQDNTSAINLFYSTIWVYGDKTLYDLRKEYFSALSFRQKIAFTGYLDASNRHRLTAYSASSHSSPYLLCLVGGGQDGFHLAETFARAEFPVGVRGILVTGSMMPPAQRKALSQLVVQRPHMKMLEFVAEPLGLLRDARAVVAMGGYNTVIEILTLNKNALIVPRVDPRQEQWIRAERLAQRGLIDCIHPHQLTVGSLSRWLARQHHFADPRELLDFGGLDYIGESVRSILADRVTTRERVS